MSVEPPDAVAIRKSCSRLLLAASVPVSGRFPTPVDDIIAAAQLSEPQDSLLSDSVLREAPLHLRRAMRRVRFKVEALLDRRAREIHLDPSIRTEGRAAFKKLHEVSHHIFPWQRALAYADDHETLSWDAKRTFEWQANYGAAELLFQGDLFRDAAADYDIGLASVQEVAGMFGTSIHAALRRYVETHAANVAFVVLPLSPCERDPVAYRRHEAGSSSRWTSSFGDATCWPQLLRSPPFDFISRASTVRTGDPPLVCPWTYLDVRGQTVELRAEIWSNSYSLLVLLWKPRIKIVRHRRTVARPT